MSASQHDWRARADLHRPTEPSAIFAEIRRQAALGLKARDISAALRIDMAQVIEALHWPLESFS